MAKRARRPKLARQAARRAARQARKPGRPGRPNAAPRAPRRPRVAPYNPLAPLTGKNLRQEMNAATSLRFGPEQRAIDAERRTAVQGEANQGKWWDDYRQQVVAAEARTRAGYQQAAGAVNAQGASSLAQSQTENAQVGAQAQQSAGLRGATVDPSLAVNAAQAGQARQAITGATAGMIGTVGANAGAHFANRAATASGIRAQEMGRERARRSVAELASRDLAREKGLFRVDFRGKAREGEREWVAVMKNFGIDAAKVTADTAADKRAAALARKKLRQDRLKERRDDRQDKREKDRRYRLDRQKFGADRADELWERRHKDRQEARLRDNASDGGGSPGGRKPLTRTQRQGFKDDYDKAVALLRTDPKWAPSKAGKFVEALVANGTPRPIARAAVQTMVGGGVRKPLRRKVKRQFEIRVPAKKHVRRRAGGVVGDVGSGADRFR